MNEMRAKVSLAATVTEQSEFSCDCKEKQRRSKGEAKEKQRRRVTKQQHGVIKLEGMESKRAKRTLRGKREETSNANTSRERRRNEQSEQLGEKRTRNEQSKHFEENEKKRGTT